MLADAWSGKAEVHRSFVTLTELEYIRSNERDAAQAAELLAWCGRNRSDGIIRTTRFAPKRRS